MPGLCLPANLSSLCVFSQDCVCQLTCLPSVCFRRTVCSLTYYGLSWNVGSLAGSVHVNIALSGVMEIVSFAVCILLLDRIGRRALCCGLLVLSGVTCTGTVFPVLFAPPCECQVSACACVGVCSGLLLHAFFGSGLIIIAIIDSSGPKLSITDRCTYV